MLATANKPALTPEYLLEGLSSQRMEIQQQIIQQSFGRAMLPKGLFDSLRRCYDLMLQDLFKEEADLERAISVLEAGEPDCIEAAFAILATPANLLGPVSINRLSMKPPVLH